MFILFFLQVAILRQALNYPPEEEAARMAVMRKRVVKNTMFGWTERMVGHIAKAQNVSRPQLLHGHSLELFLSRFQNSDQKVAQAESPI